MKRVLKPTLTEVMFNYDPQLISFVDQTLLKRVFAFSYMIVDPINFTYNPSKNITAANNHYASLSRQAVEAILNNGGLPLRN